MLLNMIGLTVLDMQIPKVRELNLSKMNIMQVGKGWDRGEQNTCREM